MGYSAYTGYVGSSPAFQNPYASANSPFADLDRRLAAITAMFPGGRAAPEPTPAELAEKQRQTYMTQDPFNLASRTNSFMAGQTMAPYLSAIPNYMGMLSSEASMVGSQLRGEVSDSTLNEILTAAAERGIVTGSPGGPNANAAYLRALGLTSEKLQSEGVSNFAKMTEMLPVPQAFNPASLYVPERLGQESLDVYNSLIGKRVPINDNSYATITNPQYNSQFIPFKV